MTSFGKIGKYLIYIQNLLYILCFIKILFSLFFYEYEPSFMKDMAFTLPLLLALIVIPIIKKNPTIYLNVPKIKVFKFLE